MPSKSFTLFSKLRKASTRSELKTTFNLQDFINTAPPEVFEEVFGKLKFKELLKCRQICKPVRNRVDQHFSKQFKIVLADRTICGKKLDHPLTIKLDTLCIEKLDSTRMTKRFVKASFEFIHTIDMFGPIGTNSFILLTQKISTLRNLKMHSSTMGGPLCLQEVNCKRTKRDVIYIKKLELVLDYIPISKSGFSSLRLIVNLREMQYWGLNCLCSIVFRVEPSTFNEQFYFGLQTFASSIPISSYKTLQTLKISCPKFKPENESSLKEVQAIFEKIQFKNLELKFQSGTNSSKPDVETSKNSVLQFANQFGLNARVFL